MADAEPEAKRRAPVGPVLGTVVPRFAGRATFCRLPALDEVSNVAVAYLGVPFDGGCSFRPGARFGPSAIRQASRNLRTQFHPAYDVEPHPRIAEPFQHEQAADAGDVSCNPFCIGDALTVIETTANEVLDSAKALVCLGGDHTIALPLLRTVHRLHGPVALIHIDAHLDTWDTYFGAPHTHGTPFRRAAEEGLFLSDASVHIGIRGPLYSRLDLASDAALGFCVIHCDEFTTKGLPDILNRVRERVGTNPVYLSIDIDSLDPAHAPGTGTPEIAGMSSREMLGLLRGLQGLQVVGCDIVEVSPSYDHAEITSLAAATIAFEQTMLLMKSDLAMGRKPKNHTAA